MKWEKKYHHWHPNYCTGGSNGINNIKYRTKHKDRIMKGKNKSSEK